MTIEIKDTDILTPIKEQKDFMYYSKKLLSLHALIYCWNISKGLRRISVVVCIHMEEMNIFYK